MSGIKLPILDALYLQVWMYNEFSPLAPIINPMILCSVTAVSTIFFWHNLLGRYDKPAGCQNASLNDLLCKTASKCDPDESYQTLGIE